MRRTPQPVYASTPMAPTQRRPTMALTPGGRDGAHEGKAERRRRDGCPEFDHADSSSRRLLRAPGSERDSQSHAQVARRASWRRQKRAFRPALLRDVRADVCRIRCRRSHLLLGCRAIWLLGAVRAAPGAVCAGRHVHDDRTDDRLDALPRHATASNGRDVGRDTHLGARAAYARLAHDRPPKATWRSSSTG